jgi:hypothetical protein
MKPMYNKKFTVLFLCVLSSLCIFAKKNDYVKIDRFIFEGRDVKQDDKILWNRNYDSILPMTTYDSVHKKNILNYVLSKYKDSTTYSMRKNIVDLLTNISQKPINRIEAFGAKIIYPSWFTNFDGDPVWLRREFFHAAMKFADHGNLGQSLSILNNDEYSESEKQELIRIFRREYPFDAGQSFINYMEMTMPMQEELRSRAEGLARRYSLDGDSLYNVLSEQLYAKYRHDFESWRTPRALFWRLGELNITEIIPDLEAKLEGKDSMEAYHSALALARMGNKKGELFLIRFDKTDLSDVIGTRNQEVVYWFAKKELQNETLFYCHPDMPDKEFPECYATLRYLQENIINMPVFLEGNPCYEERYRDPEKLKAAQEWIEQNRGKYQFAE